MIDAAYLGVVAIGLLHGVEPGHGWPVAVLYSTRQRRPVFRAILSSGIIGLGHLISSIAVVIAYVVLRYYFDFQMPWLKYVAAGVLVLLAVKLFLEKPDGMKKQHGHIHTDFPEGEHEHEHQHAGEEPHTHVHRHASGVALSLFGLASFAFILGFAHEEEFALLALVAGGANAWILMVSYGLAVLLGLVAVTVLCVRLARYFMPKLARYERYVPKVGAIFLVIMAAVICIW